jgi:hypothetical protein
VIPVCYVPVAVGGHRNCADSWDPSLIFDPSFAEHRPRMTPQSQWDSSLSIQCCLLDPYGRIKVVDSCLLCPCGCWWPQKLCWQLGSITITDFWPKFCINPTLDTTDPTRLFLAHTMLFVGSIWKNNSGLFAVEATLYSIFPTGQWCLFACLLVLVLVVSKTVMFVTHQMSVWIQA